MSFLASLSVDAREELRAFVQGVIQDERRANERQAAKDTWLTTRDVADLLEHRRTPCAAECVAAGSGATSRETGSGCSSAGLQSSTGSTCAPAAETETMLPDMYTGCFASIVRGETGRQSAHGSDPVTEETFP